LVGEGEQTSWTNAADYEIQLDRLVERLQGNPHVERVEYCLHPDVQLSAKTAAYLKDQQNLDIDGGLPSNVGADPA
jgi:hypothetical protein